ncbi:MAG: DoxX family membrane protein, partial [Candidatus Acidiferrum sp.]
FHDGFFLRLRTMQRTENTAALLGRIAMSLLFIHGGWGKLLAPAAAQAMLASHHLPMVKYGCILAVVVELGAGWRSCSGCSPVRSGWCWRAAATGKRSSVRRSTTTSISTVSGAMVFRRTG